MKIKNQMRMRIQPTTKNVHVRYGKTVKRMAITTILTWESVLIWCAIMFYGIDSKNALPKWKIIRQVIATSLVITVVMAWLCGVFGVFTRNRNLVGAAIGMSIPQLAAMIGMLMIFAKWRISIKAEDYIDWVHCVVLLAGFFLLVMKVWGTAILYMLINKRKWCFDGISLKRMSLFLCMVWELATIVMSAMVNHEQVKLEKIGKSVDSMQTMCTILNWGFRIMIIVAFLIGVFGLVAMRLTTGRAETAYCAGS